MVFRKCPTAAVSLKPDPVSFFPFPFRISFYVNRLSLLSSEDAYGDGEGEYAPRSAAVAAAQELPVS